MPDLNHPQSETGDTGYPSRGLRGALLAGLGGMMVIFALATVEGLHLLSTMRAENALLRNSSVERAQHLKSMRSCILLSHAYLSEYLIESDRRRSGDYLARVQETKVRWSADLQSYRPATVDEDPLVRQLKDSVTTHWELLSSSLNGRAADKIVPLRISVTGISSQLDGIDAKQAAATEFLIESQFEHLGSRLMFALAVGLAAALLLAWGCIVYLSRIERQNGLRYGQVLGARGQLEQLSARLVEAQENERRTISRELHDQVGQTLNALLVDAANLAKRLPAGDTASLRYLDNIRIFADSSVNSIRDIALLLRPSMLDDLGLIPALEWQARELSRRSGINVKVTEENVKDSIPEAMRTCIYRIVQEALANVARHAGAKSAMVTVRQQDGLLSLSVEDDGCGFDPEKTKGLGRLGMEERVRQLGGKFEIRSAPGAGTTLLVTLPLPAAAVTSTE